MPAVSGAAIAGDALKYIGHPYVFGGSPGPDGSGGWDCSSFVSWVLGHDFGMQLPGTVKAGYNGSSHGPVVSQYAAWRGAKTVGSPEAGDLVIYLPNQHIGIATSPSQMVSALNPGLGTLQGAIQGAAPGMIMFRRIGAAGSGSPIGSLQGCIPGAGLVFKLTRVRFS